MNYTGIFILSPFRRSLSTFFLLFLFVIGYSTFLEARNLDSLKQTIVGSTKGMDVNKLLDFAAQESNRNLDIAIAYVDFALDKAIASKDKRLVFNVFREKGFFYENNNVLDSSLVAYETALQLAKEVGDENLKLVMYTDLAIINRKLGIYSKTKEYHLTSLELATDIGNLENVEFAYHGLGFLYETIGDYDEAIEYYLHSIEVAEKRGSISGVITTLQNIGTTYLKLDNNKLALATIEKAYKLAKQENDTLHIANVLHDYGQILRDAGYLDEALEKLQASLNVYKKVNVKPIIARTLIHIADIYTKKGQYKLAEEYFQRCLKYEKFIRSQDFSDLYNKWGNLYLKSGNSWKAQRAFLKSLAISQEHKFKTISQENHKSLYEINLAHGTHEKALKHLQDYIELKDYIFNQEKANNIAEMQFRFDMEKNEKEIQLLRLRQNRTLLIGSSAFFIFVVFFLIYMIKTRGKNNMALMTKNGEIQKQNIKLRESNEVLNQFAYVAAHDLKEPLRNIGSFVNLIQIKYGHQFNEEAMEYMSFVTTGVKRLNSLLIDLLEYSRISSQAATREQLHISKTIDEVLINLKGIVKEKKAIIQYPGDLPSIRMSKLHLIQIFQNLLTNALKFVDKTPHIIIDAKHINGDIVISVEDNGIGINKDFGNKIFNLFQQLNKGKKYEGTGIGLTICKNIIDKYDGRVWFESQVGKGTTFFISIPLETKDDEQSDAVVELTELVSSN